MYCGNSWNYCLKGGLFPGDLNGEKIPNLSLEFRRMLVFHIRSVSGGFPNAFRRALSKGFQVTSNPLKTLL